jgi:phenylalanyl-tRNA synthetase beta chain
LDYIRKQTGIHDISSNNVISVLEKMCLATENINDNLIITIPITRSDIIHACDIAEDVGIAYGYDTIYEK